MKQQLKNWWWQSKIKCATIFTFFVAINLYGQNLANYVTNGSFEQHSICSGGAMINVARGWRSIDSAYFSGVYYSSICFSNVPLDGASYQWPKKGSSFGGPAGLLCVPPTCSIESNRGYFRNRLKRKLDIGTTYCVKFYINISNYSTYGVDGVGAAFLNDDIDTIKKPAIPLIYINPQVLNNQGNIIKDTLNWVPITGTFTATGIEKHLVIGNFKSDNATTKTLINQAYLPVIGADFNLDDVSCIPIDLPAWAGHDTTCIPGTTVYIGRTQDVEIDESCTWYQLPNITTPIAQGVAGLTVSPAQTTTYVVKQQLWCSGIKYDTVVVYKDALGLRKQEALNDELKIYPVPAKSAFSIKATNKSLYEDLEGLTLYDAFGNKLRFEELKENPEKDVDISNLTSGIYFVEVVTKSGEKVVRKLIISNN